MLEVSRSHNNDDSLLSCMAGADKVVSSSMMGAKQVAFCTRAFLGSTPTGTGSPPKTSSGGGDSPNLRHNLEKRLCFAVKGDRGGGVNGDRGGCEEGIVKKVVAEATVEVGEEFGKSRVMEDRYAWVVTGRGIVGIVGRLCWDLCRLPSSVTAESRTDSRRCKPGCCASNVRAGGRYFFLCRMSFFEGMEEGKSEEGVRL